MVLGADTGFFVAYAKNHPRAHQVWRELEQGLHTLIVSTLTINEILVYFYQRGNGTISEQWLDLMTQTSGIKVIPVSVAIASRSAKYRHTFGLPTVDSVILATMVEQKCERVFSTDGHFRTVDQKVIPVEFLL